MSLVSMRAEYAPRRLDSYRDVIFFDERFSALRVEGQALFVAHWREASADLSVPLGVNWEIYEALERSGLETCVTARKDGLLIGYAVYILYPHPHYRTQLVADSDAFFLDRVHRRGAVGLRLFRVAETLVAERGAGEVWNRVKLHVKPGRGRSDLGPLFGRLGYRPVETVWRKRLG